MSSVVFVVPGSINSPTGGSVYDRRMSEQLHSLGWRVDVAELDPSFPYPTPEALEQAARVFDDVPAGAIVLVDGLALGAMPSIVERAASSHRIVALVHLPLAAEVGLDRETSARFEVTERRALAAAALVIVTGEAALPMLDRYSLSASRVVVVGPGTDPAPLARGSSPGDPLHLLCVATVNHGKGHEVLMEALAELPRTRWRLTCAGSATRDLATADRVRAAARRLSLEERVRFVGELDAVALGHCYDTADLFVLATLQETFGMAVAEALARGIPVVSTRTGAIPALVGTAAGLLVPPADKAALAQALASAIEDDALRARLAEGARQARGRLTSWHDAGERMSAALGSLDAHE